MPGESLFPGSSRFQPSTMPLDSPVNDIPGHAPASSEIIEMLKGIQEGVDNKFSTISEKLDIVCDRLNILENRQKSMEECILIFRGFLQSYDSHSREESSQDSSSPSGRVK